MILKGVPDTQEALEFVKFASQTVKQNADNARQANVLATKATEIAVKEGLHNPFPARRAVCCPRCSGGEDAGTSITVLFEP
ncbi:hypothetical protein [Paraburkholderia sediminicola]|uniref:hypothetical protein n=1 Tax=Paraburkholderia sediminicola TaxID=458836 RepID=UPI000E730488